MSIMNGDDVVSSSTVPPSGRRLSICVIAAASFCAARAPSAGSHRHTASLTSATYALTTPTGHVVGATAPLRTATPWSTECERLSGCDSTKRPSALPGSRSASCRGISLKLRVPDGQHLVDEQNLRLEVRRHRKRQPQYIPLEYRLTGVSMNAPRRANSTISSNRRSTSAGPCPGSRRSDRRSPGRSGPGEILCPPRATSRSRPRSTARPVEAR